MLINNKSTPLDLTQVGDVYGRPSTGTGAVKTVTMGGDGGFVGSQVTAIFLKLQRTQLYLNIKNKKLNATKQFMQYQSMKMKLSISLRLHLTQTKFKQSSH